jgi:hypothetical protein
MQIRALIRKGKQMGRLEVKEGETWRDTHSGALVEVTRVTAERVYYRTGDPVQDGHDSRVFFESWYARVGPATGAKCWHTDYRGHDCQLPATAASAALSKRLSDLSVLRCDQHRPKSGHTWYSRDEQSRGKAEIRSFLEDGSKVSYRRITPGLPDEGRLVPIREFLMQYVPPSFVSA